MCLLFIHYCPLVVHQNTVTAIQFIGILILINASNMPEVLPTPAEQQYALQSPCFSPSQLNGQLGTAAPCYCPTSQVSDCIQLRKEIRIPSTALPGFINHLCVTVKCSPVCPILGESEKVLFVGW